MGLFAAIRREYHFLKTMRTTLKRLEHIDPNSPFLLTDEMEAAVDRFHDRIAIIADDQTWTYQEFENYANQVAHWALAQGLKPGDTVTLFSHNRLEYVAIWYGLSKVGVIAALLNTSLVGHSLVHCISVAQSKALISETGLIAEVRAVAAEFAVPLPLWCLDASHKDAQDFGAALQALPIDRPNGDLRADLRGKDPVLKMFTSGTTGLPKAAPVSHSRAQRYMSSFSASVGAGPKDRMMMVLPLYHATGGLCGVGPALLLGGALIVERQFSASRFWDVAVRHKATLFMYVGELCRFLLSTPQTPCEKQHRIRAMIGNGLSKDVWLRFRDRFNIRKITEFYGATEGNVGMFNADGQVAAIGRVPSYAQEKFNIALVQIDLDSQIPLRGADGFCLRAEDGTAGEAIGLIDTQDARYRFDGYGTKAETEKKILRDVFKKGDAYFRTGDLMRTDRHGYYYFVDRVGDTFRWMAENVSTGEVAAAFSSYADVTQANVYGVAVPGHDGRAGMAAFVPTGDIDHCKLYHHLAEQLPVFAIPLFLREQRAAETTGTFKFRKVDLVEQGYDPDKVSESLFVLDRAAQTYIPMTKMVHRQILAGKARI